MLEGVLAPGGTASEVKIPGYELAGKTGTANKIDAATGTYSDSRYVASFVGMAPARRPALLVAVSSTSRRARSTAAQVAAPAFGRDRRRSRCRICGSRRPSSAAAASDREPRSLPSMLLRDLFADGGTVAGGRALAEVDSALDYDARACGPGRVFFCVPGSPATATTSRRQADRSAARRRSSCSARSASACPRCVVAGRAGRDGARRGAAAGDPDRARSRSSGITGTNGKTTTALPDRARCSRPPASAAGCWAPSSRSSAASRCPPCGRRLRRSTCSRRSRQMLAGRRRGLRDGGLLARARAAPRRRDPLGGRGLHEPHPGPPRLPRHDGRLLRGQAAAVRGRARGPGGQHRRPATGRAAGGRLPRHGQRRNRQRGREAARDRRRDGARAVPPSAPRAGPGAPRCRAGSTC